MIVRTIAFLLTISVSGCMMPGKLPHKSLPDLLKVQQLAMAPVGVPAAPSVRILNSNSDWFYVPGFVAKGAYVGYAGAEVGALLKQAEFDYGSVATRFFEQAIANSGLSLARTDAPIVSETRQWSLSKCPRQIAADACIAIHLTYFGYVAAFDTSDYVPTAHISAKVIRNRDGLLLFERNIHYNPIDPSRAINVFASDEFRFHDLDAMRADPQRVAAGLRTALSALASELEAQLQSSLKANAGE